MRARESILARLRRTTNTGPTGTDVTAHVQPNLNTDALVDRFCSRLKAAAATRETLADAAALPDRVFAYAVREGLSGPTAIAPALAKYEWPSALSPEFGTTDGGAVLGVNLALAGVAETGSLVLVSAPETPTGLNFLPEFSIVVVAQNKLVRHLEDAWEVVGWPRPRAINLITGPSRTADVEQTLQLGAHGPRELHVMLLPG